MQKAEAGVSSLKTGEQGWKGKHLGKAVYWQIREQFKENPPTRFSEKPDPVVFASSENQDQCQKSLMIVFIFSVHCASHRERQPYLEPAADKEPSSDDCALH